MPTRSWLGSWRSGTREYVGESGIVGAVRDEPNARVAALDGLRAIAILLVIIHNAGSLIGSHSGPAITAWGIVSNAGWVGVQLFFALSGFLITRILLEGKGESGWMRAFYIRRALRIVPLYYLLLVIVFFVVPHVASLSALGNHGTRSFLWYWSYLSNWVSPFEGTAKALSHVWSLAVEEQFYLVWPLVVAVLGERALARFCVGLVLAALAARGILHMVLPEEIARSAAYTWTITRSDTIAFGALVALALRNDRARESARAWLPVALLAAGAAIAVIFVAARGLADQGTVAEFAGQPLTGVFSALVVLACVGQPVTATAAARVQRTLVRILSTPALTTIGKYSYAVYVFHLPVHHVLRPRAEHWLAGSAAIPDIAVYVLYTAVVFTIAFVLALISWRLIEQPFLALKRHFPMPSRATAA